MEGGLKQAARQAAAAARAQREAWGLPPLPERKYLGVRKRGGSYGAEIRDRSAGSRRTVWLGSYETAEEAAHAYDAAARILQGDRARPNFPYTLPAPAPAPVGDGDVAPPPPPASFTLECFVAMQLCEHAYRAQEAANAAFAAACHATLAVLCPPQQPAAPPAPAHDASTSRFLPPATLDFEFHTAIQQLEEEQERAFHGATAPAAPEAATPQTRAFQGAAAPAPAPQYLYQPPLAAAATNAAAFQPQSPATYVAPGNDVPAMSTWPASSAVSHAWETFDASQSRQAASKRRRLALPPTHHGLPVDVDSFHSMTADNFTDDDLLL
ncbi:hypothetical protein ACP70R_043393 [Stipagrostis hirtigluma subsp. patula]